MTKYSSEFKVKLVREWATDGLSSYQLAKKYHLSHHYIQYWIEQARLQGITSLQHRRGKRTFSADFKLSVINYYQTHEESMAMVAANMISCLIKLVIGNEIFIKAVTRH